MRNSKNNGAALLVAEKKLAAQETMGKDLLMNAPAFVCTLLGPTYIYDLVNARYQSFFGKRKIQGKPMMEALPELAGQGFDKLLDKVYETGETYLGIEIPIMLARDENLAPALRYFNFSYQPMYDENRTIFGILVFGYEVTQEALANKKTQESESYFRLIAELMPEQVATATPGGIPTFYNKAWQDYTGASFDELMTEGWEKWIHPDDVAETTKQWLLAVETGSDFEMEFRIRNRNGEYRWHKNRAKAVKDENGAVKLWIGFNSDIDEQKKRNAALEIAVANRTNELQEANQELQQKNQEIAVGKYNKQFLTDFSERFAGYKRQNEFFNSLVQFVADSTGLDYALIGKLEPNGPDQTNVQTLALAAFGQLTENINYPLSNTPCEDLLNGTPQSYAENCRVIFPENRYQIDGYVGLPLYDAQQKAVGVIAVMHKQKIADVETISSVLRVVAKRAEVELERIKNEELLAEKNILLEEKNQFLEQMNQELQQKNQEVEDSKEKLLSEYSRRLIEASLDPLITISIEGKITDMNAAWVRATGSSRKKITGSNFFDYFTEPQKAQEGYEQVFAKGFVADYPLTIKDHKLTDVLFNGSVYKDAQGKVLGVVVVARDITEQKRIEKELMEAKVFAELATVIAEQAQSNAELAAQTAESATQVAENAVKSKQQFLSNMSHEIRTPMNAIIGFTKVVLKTDLSAKQKEYITAIKVSGDALIVLINDILDLAKVDAGKMSFEKTPFKLSLSIAAMLHLFETKIQEKNLKLITKYDKNIPEVLVGDPVRLHQIILNLVSNAVKFTNTGNITVSVLLLNEDEENVTVEFTVTDTGIGIAADQIASVFDNFQQATSDTSRLYGGTGLGLAIVKQLVEPQGGHIQVTSKENGGSTFRFTLPFQKTQAEPEIVADIMDSDSDNKGIKVLVVEDMALNQLLMKTLLDDFGFECDIAANGKLATEKLRTKTYDMVLMDLQMPEMNGFEATHYIRNVLKLNVPIIALTADVTTVDLAKCRAVGMNDYIAKPVDERLLYSKIVSLVKKPVDEVEHNSDEKEKIKRFGCIDLAYLKTRTKANTALMMEMISIYLEQTPPLVSSMKQSFHEKDWQMLYAAVHKMIPSFAIMGISADFENMAKKIQEYAHTQLLSEEIHDLVLQLEHICTQACEELKEELKKMQNH